MLYNPKIHPVSHVIKSVLGTVEKLFSGIDRDPLELIVVNYHSTPQRFISNFRKQIIFFNSNFNIISPDQLDDFYAGKLNSDKCSLLITFDDGLRNNLNAALVLDEFNLKAFFFIVPAFLTENKKNQKDYYLKNIRPIINSFIDSNEEDFIAMTSEEISRLLMRGHSIGSHTYTHTLVASNSDMSNSEKEIISSRDFLETNFNRSVTSFCSINNSLESIATKEKALVHAHYKFHFTTLPGQNKNGERLYIKRRNIESHWLKGAVFYAIGKWDLNRWKERINEYLKL